MIAPAGLCALQPVPVRAERGARAALARQEAKDDAERVRRFLAGDEEAFGEIVAVHRERIHALALSFLRNHADAEEITQDTFIRAHRGLRYFRGEAALATWLHRIALNLARNRYWYFRRRQRHATLSLDAAFSEINPVTYAERVVTDEADPARAAVTREFSRVVSVCMARLGDRPREILTLRNTLNRSYREIAGEIGISVGTVKSRVARARAALRELLAEACPEFGVDAPPVAWLEPIRPGPGVTAICA
jgi:RNA polymerase sigma-70 factor (ECF subfamily)